MISANLISYKKTIYKTEASESPTIFHISIILKKKKRNKTFIKPEPDALPFPFTMLCLLFTVFLYQLLLYQLLFDQTHDKPTAKHRISSKDPQIPQSKPTIPLIPTNQQTPSSSKQRSISFLKPPICHKPPTSNLYNLEMTPHLPWISSSPWPHIPQSKPTIPTNPQTSSFSEQRSSSFLRPPICHKPPTCNLYNLETVAHILWVSSSSWPINYVDRQYTQPSPSKPTQR